MPQYVSRYVFIVSMLVALVVGALAGGATALVVPYFSRPSPVSVSSTPELLITSGDEQVVTGVVQRVLSSVVAIGVSESVAARTNSGMATSSSKMRIPEMRRKIGGGSGFFVSADGLIVTNRHVVEDAKADYTVTLEDGTTYPARVLDRDPSLDLAILKVEISQAPSLSLGDSDGVRIGETVLAIGNALARFQNTVTKGIISGTNRHILADGVGGSELIEGAIQTDAAINLGNSGGPLINLKGEVVGVTTAVSGDGQSLGFAIPSNAVKQAVESVKRSGHIVRPWLGVRYFMIDDEVSEANNLPVKYGALVSRGPLPKDAAVAPGSPADKAGILENDIILEVEQQKLTENHSLASALSSFSPGDRVHIRVLRHGEEKQLILTLDERASIKL